MMYKYILICKHKYKYLDFNFSTYVYTQPLFIYKVRKISILYNFSLICYKKTHSYRQ